MGYIYLLTGKKSAPADWVRVLVLLALIGAPLQGHASAAGGDSARLSFRVLSEAPPDSAIDEVCCRRGQSWRTTPLVEQFSIGFGEAPLWIKLDGVSEGGVLRFSSMFDEIRLYTRVRGESHWNESRTCDSVTHAIKELDTPFMAFRVPKGLDPDAVYALIRQSSAVSFRVEQLSSEAFESVQRADRILETFLLGFVCAIIIYNLVIGALVRDVAYLLNALCIASLMISALYLSGYGVLHVWGEWFAYSNAIFTTSIVMGLVFGSAFLWRFLRVAERGPRHGLPIFIAPAVAVTAAAGFGLTGKPYWMTLLVALCASLVLFATVAVYIVRGLLEREPKARILAFPFAFAMLPGLSMVALEQMAGWRPFGLGVHVMELTLAVEAILFSVALAARIRVTEAINREAARKLLLERERRSTVALAAQDAERKRLAGELHDSVGQEMLVVVGQLKRLQRADAASAVQSALPGLVASTADILNKLRRISRDMHPAFIEHLGLVGAIASIVEQFNRAAGIRFEYALPDLDPGLEPAAQVHLFRIVQECLSNVSRHSGATRCMVALTIDGDRLNLRVDDNGKGLADEDRQVALRAGLGLTSIDERVRSLDGRWGMSHSPLGGLSTEVTIRLEANRRAVPGAWA